MGGTAPGKHPVTSTTSSGGHGFGKCDDPGKMAVDHHCPLRIFASQGSPFKKVS
jgi:hypothetical protein